MRKNLFYGILLAAAVLVPAERTNLQKMKPVEAVYLYMEDGDVAILTDTGDRGVGQGVEKAIADLKERTAGIIYLDTADYLLIGQGGEQHIPALAQYLKKTVRVCQTEGEVDMERVGAYLSVHRPEVQLKDWERGGKLPFYPVEKKMKKLE